jgi:hypothetical protein
LKDVALDNLHGLGFAAHLNRALAKLGYARLTLIQDQAISPLMKGRALIGIAETGIGKTAAFGLLILNRLATDRRPRPRAGARVLVLNRTRELASQIMKCVLWALLSTIVFPAHAMTYSFHKLSAHEIVIDASGRIEQGELLALQRFMNNYIPQGLVVRGISLNSRGGEINDAADLVKYVKKEGWNTSIPAGGVCASACVMVWSSGAEKSALYPFWVGVHQSFDDYANKDGTLSNTGTQEMDGVLRANGAPEHVLEMQQTTPPSSVYWLTDDDLKSWSVEVNNAKEG